METTAKPKMKWVLITDNAGKKAMVNLKKDKRIRWKPKMFLDARKIPVDQLPGYFRPDRKDFINITDEVLAEEQSNLILEQTNTANGGNARIDSTLDLQKLTDTDIHKMRNEGVKGDAIIAEISKNNENFDKRTEYSKQKYLKKKKGKYMTNLFIEKPTMSNVFDFTITTNFKQCIFLREDAFNLYCQLCEIKEDSRVFCVDKSKGLLISYITRVLNPEKHGHCYVADYNTDKFNRNSYKCLEYLGL